MWRCCQDVPQDLGVGVGSHMETYSLISDLFGGYIVLSDLLVNDGYIILVKSIVMCTQ